MAESFTQRMTHGGQFGVKLVRGCLGGGFWFARPDGTQDAQEPIGLPECIVERKHVQGLWLPPVSVSRCPCVYM